MRVTIIIILFILHNFIYYEHILHIIRSYAVRPWNHGLNIRTSQNEDSTNGTSTREPSLEYTESVLFIHTYFIFIHLCTKNVFLDSHRIHCAMTKNDLVSLLESSSLLDFPIQTPLVSFISLCALHEVW